MVDTLFTLYPRELVWKVSNQLFSHSLLLGKVLNNVARHERKSFSFSTIFVLLWFRFSFLLLRCCFEDSRELGSSVVFFREKTATDALSWDSTEKPDPHSLSLTSSHIDALVVTMRQDTIEKPLPLLHTVLFKNRLKVNLAFKTFQY